MLKMKKNLGILLAVCFVMSVTAAAVSADGVAVSGAAINTGTGAAVSGAATNTGTGAAVSGAATNAGVGAAVSGAATNAGVGAAVSSPQINANFNHRNGFNIGSDQYEQGYRDGYSKGSSDGQKGCSQHGSTEVLLKIPTPSNKDSSYREGFKLGYIAGYNQQRYSCLKNK